MPFTVGENIGPYRITEQLGHGGMATVFKAYHAALDRYVAIKALHPAFTVEPNFLERFQREARVVAKLEHPNIVPIYDYSEHDGRPYLVMKFIDGETLKARLNRGPLEPAEMDKIVESVGAALAYAHQQGVLHRDIKPSNVLLSTEGRVYLADFGLARMAQAGESTISSDVLLGTPQYISPEQALGKRDLDNGTDIYSFGVLLYELIVGRVPYSADTPYSVIHDHIYTPLPMPRSIRPEIPEAVERVLLKAMAKERADRFLDVDALLDAWKQARPGQPVQAAPPAAQPVGVELPPPAAKDRVAKNSPASTVVLNEAQLESAQASTTSAVLVPAKKAPRRWLWIAAIPLALCLCLVLLLLVSQKLRTRLFSAIGVGAQPAVTLANTATVAALQPTRPAGTALPPPPQKTPRPLVSTLTARPTKAQPSPARPLQTQQLVTPISLEQARQHVTAQPDDPLAHVELAIGLLDAGQADAALEELTQAESIAGNDAYFYFAAGRMFEQQRYALYAAEAYSKAIHFAPSPSEDLTFALKRAMYQAAANPAFANFLERADLKQLEPEFIEIVRGRYTLLVNNDIEGALQVVKKFSTGENKFYEVKLLEAEILWKQGKTNEARKKLTTLYQDQQAPAWVHVLAEIIMRETFR